MRDRFESDGGFLPGDVPRDHQEELVAMPSFVAKMISAAAREMVALFIG